MDAGGLGRQLIDGRFELLDRLGGGGMGLVWRAWDTALHREVALKEVRPPDPTLLETDPAAARVLRERVLREARALARLHHPNVVTIYHIVDAPDIPHPWLVMELVTGGSLDDRLQHGPVTPPEAATIGRGIVSALRAAHEAGIQHRDVKPANVLLRPDGTPVLTDFGIAALRESTNLTATGALIGSPEYIAPERIRGEEGNPASDLWSLGMLIYVAVEGHNPLRRATTLATLAAVLDAPIPPPARCGPLTPVLSALLARDPATRPDAAQLDRLLAEAERGLTDAVPPPEAHSYSPPPESWAPVDEIRGRAKRANGTKRSTMFVASITATALAGVAGAVAWTLNSLPTTANHAGAPGSSSISVSGPSASNTPATADPTAATPPAASQTSTGNLLSPAGIRTVINALRSAAGGTRVVELNVYSNFADAEVPTTADPTVFDNFMYRNGVVTRSTGSIVNGQTIVDLASINWNALPALLAKANTQLGVPHPTDNYVIVRGDWFGANPAFLVYAKDAYRAGYLAADGTGRVVRMWPSS